MAKDVWFPKGYQLPDCVKIRSLLFSGENWQVYSTLGSYNILIVRLEMAQKWSKEGFLDESLFKEIIFGESTYQLFASPKKYCLYPVASCASPDTKVEALSLSLALRESRKISKEVSFHDAIYVEQYSRLLPTWTLTPRVDDETVLGTWITGGVVISTNSFRRLSVLVGWMTPRDLAEVISAAGLVVPVNYGIKGRTSKDEQAKETLVVEKGSGLKLGPKLQTSGAENRVFLLPGRPQLEAFFNDHVVDIIFNPDRYRALGIEFPSAIVLHGPPGCGKTFAVERLVEFIDWPSYSIDANSVGSPYIHETSRKISEVFNKAIDNAPSVIVIDEMESYLSDRQTSGFSGTHHIEEVAEFLKRIPEAINHNVLIIAMTNMIDVIDPAILRRGRFDHIIEVGMPCRDEVESLLKSMLSKIPIAENLDISPLLEKLTGKPLSDTAFVIREAARLAAKAGCSCIDQNSITEALASLPKEHREGGRRIGF